MEHDTFKLSSWSQFHVVPSLAPARRTRVPHVGAKIVLVPSRTSVPLVLRLVSHISQIRTSYRTVHSLNCQLLFETRRDVSCHRITILLEAVHA